MRIVFRPQARRDLIWFRKYYRSVFPEGARNAYQHYEAALSTLSQSPFAGYAAPDSHVRVLGIARTPFSFVYMVKDGDIRLLRVFDNRSRPVERWDET